MTKVAFSARSNHGSVPRKKESRFRCLTFGADLGRDEHIPCRKRRVVCIHKSMTAVSSKDFSRNVSVPRKKRGTLKKVSVGRHPPGRGRPRSDRRAFKGVLEGYTQLMGDPLGSSSPTAHNPHRAVNDDVF